MRESMFHASFSSQATDLRLIFRACRTSSMPLWEIGHARAGTFKDSTQAMKTFALGG